VYQKVTKLMKSLSLVLISLLTLFTSGCWFEEEQRESITGGLSPMQIFADGKLKIEGGQLDEAIKIFERLEAAYPASKYAMQSKLEIIFSLNDRDRFDEAIDSANEFIKLYPDHFSTPYAYYLRAISSEEKSRSILDDYITDNAERDISSVRQAFIYYMDLIKKFPDSQYAEEAKDRLVVIRNIVARSELVVAIFYTKNKAHIGAINRCKFILENYPNTPSVPAAIHLMAFNYDKLGATVLADDARRVLKLSYPNYLPHYSLEN